MEKSNLNMCDGMYSFNLYLVLSEILLDPSFGCEFHENTLKYRQLQLEDLYGLDTLQCCTILMALNPCASKIGFWYNMSVLFLILLRPAESRITWVSSFSGNRVTSHQVAVVVKSGYKSIILCTSLFILAIFEDLYMFQRFI